MTSVTNKDVLALVKLFDGYQEKIGQTTLGQKDARGKLEAKCKTIDGAATLERWQAHIEGKAGLGIIPLRADDTIVWGAIDVDVYPTDPIALETKLRSLEVPLFVFQSKSGGAHLIAFFDQPIPADKARSYLERCAKKLGYDGCEIFPKQVKRTRPGEVGNWLNMPYFGGMEHGRYAIINGQPATIQDLLEALTDEN